MKKLLCLLLPAVFLTACTTVPVQLPANPSSPVAAATAPKATAPAPVAASEVGSSPAAAAPTVGATAGPSALSGTTWQLQSIERIVENRNETLDPAPTLQFDTAAPGQIDGTVGCNLYQSEYSLAADDTLGLGELLVTDDSFCADLMRVQTLYLDALETMSRVRATPTELTLSDETGALELYFVPAPSDGQ